jgi:hypothetical protein
MTGRERVRSFKPCPHSRTKASVASAFSPRNGEKVHEARMRGVPLALISDETDHASGENDERFGQLLPDGDRD